MVSIKNPATKLIGGFLLLLITLSFPTDRQTAEAASGQTPYISIVESRQVVKGVNYWRLKGVNSAGQALTGHALEVDINDPLIEVRPVLAQDRIGQVETVSSMAARYGAVGAVNASYFDLSGSLAMPVGNVVLDGKLLAESDFWRTSFGLTPKGEFLYGFFNPKPSIRVSSSGFTATVGNIDGPYNNSLINLYYRAWGETTATPAGTREIVLIPQDQSYVVTATGTGNSDIPNNGIVLAADPSLLPDLATGTKVDFDPGLSPGWEQVGHALTGGPLLVEGGRPVYQSVQEGFTGTAMTTRKARTAVALQQNGRLLLVVFEESGNDSGVNLEEASVLLVSLGAATAVGLDGGGSSAMAVQGQLVSKPTYGQERQVSNAIVVLRQIPVYLDGWFLPCDVPSTIEGGRVLVPLRAIFEGLGATVEWDQKTRQVTASKGDRRVQLTVDSRNALVDGKPLSLDVPARIVQGRTLVPVRFVSQALGASVQWDEEERTVYITP